MRCLRPAALAAIATLAALSCTSARSARVFLSAGEEADVPATFARGLILVDATLDGAAVGTFLLDTGSDVSVIDRSLEQRLQLPRESAAIARGAGGSVSTSIVKAKSLAIGPLTASEPSLLVLDLSPFERVVGRPIAGIAGLDLLEGRTLQLDYAARRVRAFAPGVRPPTQAPWQRLERRESLLGLSVQLGSQRAETLLLDTGMTGALALDDAIVRALGDDARRERDTEWRVSVGGGSEEQIASVRSVGVGGAELAAVDAVLARPAGRFAGAVGAGLLRFFRVTLDLATDEISLERLPSAAAMEGASGLRYERARGGLRVVAVAGESPADEAGLLPGDLVTHVDGLGIGRLGWRGIRERFSFTGRKCELTVARGLREVQLSLY